MKPSNEAAKPVVKRPVGKTTGEHLQVWST